MKNNEIKMGHFEFLKGYMNSSCINYIIESHKELIGKKAKDKYTEINDCGVEMIRHLLNRDWGRSIVYEYSDAAKNFMNSKYLSNYIKHELKKMLGKMNYYAKTNDYYNDDMKKLLNSNKTLNEMDENEIKYIFNHLKFCMYNKELKLYVDTKIVECFNLLLYKLDGKGINSLLKDDNYINKTSLANHILLTSGLSERASFYSGRGVNYGDLSDKHLLEIFRKLIKLDLNYAVNFVKMVMEMKTLGATEFINSFKDLVNHNFNFEESKTNDKNISLDDVHGEARNIVAFASILSSYNKEDEDYQIRQSDRMKGSFLFYVKSILEEINPKLSEEIKNIGYVYRRR